MSIYKNTILYGSVNINSFLLISLSIKAKKDLSLITRLYIGMKIISN